MSPFEFVVQAVAYVAFSLIAVIVIGLLALSAIEIWSAVL
jgi:hypothetical protein